MNTVPTEPLVIPPAATDANAMAMRVVEIAKLLTAMGIKPSHLDVSLTFMYGQEWLPLYGDELSPQPARDAVGAQMEWDEFHRVVTAWSLSIYDDGKPGNLYASGIVNGVAVQIYTSKDLDPAAVQS